MVGVRQLQLEDILKNLKSKALISIQEIDELIGVCYRVISELVERTKQRENWRKRALKAEEELKVMKGGLK